jgi:phosphonate transport system substrate-binding protein
MFIDIRITNSQIMFFWLTREMLCHYIFSQLQSICRVAVISDFAHPQCYIQRNEVSVKVLKLSSCMADSKDFVCARIAAYISECLNLSATFVSDIAWQEREQLLDTGEIHICWICGLTYIRKADAPDSNIALLVAPVMRGSRYKGQPVYFSDVVVHRESKFHGFEDLEGASWAYTERRSHSGFNLVSYQLSQTGRDWGFFGKVHESGAHGASLRMILTGEIDATAIDSTVLEMEILRDPDLRSQIRVIDTWGPSPIPPWVILRTIPEPVRVRLQQVLLNMHQDPRGRELLSDGPIERFVQVEDAHYDPIRRMFQVSKRVTEKFEETDLLFVTPRIQSW